MFGDPRRLFGQDTSKPRSVGSTLSRLGSYFKPYWLLLGLVAILMVLNAWVQVYTPQLTGQAVDCYLTPAGAQPTQPAAGQTTSGSAAQHNCWYDPLPANASAAMAIR